MNKILAKLVLVLGFLGSSVAYSATSTWSGNPGSWSAGAPSSSTSSTDFVIASGSENCILSGGIIRMKSLTIQASSNLTLDNSATLITSGTMTIDGTLTNNSDVIVNNLTVNGTLNNNLYFTISNKFVINGSISDATSELSYNLLTDTDDNNRTLEISKPGGINLSQIISGETNFKYLSTLIIKSGVSLTIDRVLYILSSLTLNQADLIVNDTLKTKNLTLQSSNTISGSQTLQVRRVGGTNGDIVAQTGSSTAISCPVNTYSMSVATGGTLNLNNTVRDTTSLTIDGTGICKTNNSSTTLGTLTLTGGGTFSSLNTSAHTLAVTTFSTIQGKLYLNPQTSLTYSGSSVDLNGTNSSIAYLNKPILVGMSGTNDTIRNCTFRKLNVTGTSVIVNNAGAYKIGNITTSGAVTITSHTTPTDTLYIGGTGSITLNSGVKVNKLVDIVAGGSLASGGNLTMMDQADLYFVTSGQITGDINVKRKYGSAGWIYLGAPFSGPARNTIYSGTGTVGMNKYVESQIFTSPRWASVGASESLSPGTGYVFAINNPPSNDTLTLTGSPSLNDVTVSGLTFTTTNSTLYDSQRGYNLVANPFTAPIEIAGFFTDNGTKIGNALYFWDVATTGKSNGVYVCRTSGGVYTPDLSTVTAKNQSKISASYISPHQAFFVKVANNNESILFDNARITRDKNTTFLKSTPAFIRLNVNNNSGTKNDIVFQFNDAASNGFDKNLDYYKLKSDNYPVEIYSLIGNEEFAIQTIKNITDETRIPIGLIIKNAEKHEFKITDFNAVPSDINIYINDLTAKRFVNLRDSSFSVSLAAGTYNNRFEVVFKKGTLQQATGIIDETNLNEIEIGSLNNRIVIDFPMKLTEAKVHISDINGRQLYSQNLFQPQGNVSINYTLEANKVYIVKISGSSFSKIKKVIVQ